MFVVLLRPLRQRNEDDAESVALHAAGLDARMARRGEEKQLRIGTLVVNSPRGSCCARCCCGVNERLQAFEEELSLLLEEAAAEKEVFFVLDLCAAHLAQSILLLQALPAASMDAQEIAASAEARRGDAAMADTIVPASVWDCEVCFLLQFSALFERRVDGELRFALHFRPPSRLLADTNGHLDAFFPHGLREGEDSGGVVPGRL
jgi:hypothetical protein